MGSRKELFLVEAMPAIMEELCKELGNEFTDGEIGFFTDISIKILNRF